MKIRKFGFLLKYKNNFLRNIYFFYNIYIRNFKCLRNSSQFKEDIFLDKFFKSKKNGKYVDLGCFHPTRDNNTYQLYKKNWSGLNIDLNPLTIELFNYFRNRDINLNFCLSKLKTTKKLFYFGEFSPLNTINQNHLKFLKKNFNLDKKSYKIKIIKTENINNILKKYNFFKIDFLSIDLEGHESEILNDFRFDLFKIDLICIETLNHNLMSVKNKNKIQKILKKNNFKLIYKTGVNSFYKNNERASSSKS